MELERLKFLYQEKKKKIEFTFKNSAASITISNPTDIYAKHSFITDMSAKTQLPST